MYRVILDLSDRSKDVLIEADSLTSDGENVVFILKDEPVASFWKVSWVKENDNGKS